MKPALNVSECGTAPRKRDSGQPSAADSAEADQPESDLAARLLVSPGGRNNGNVYGIEENKTGTTDKDQTFGYDNLNRLISASNPGGWGMTFTMDHYGNHPTQTCTGGAPSTSMTISASTNRITTSGYESDGDGGRVKRTANGETV